jgi:hypothetical protein
LFEPAEYEYNHGLCDATFEELMGRGAFGSHAEIPQSLKGRNIHFQFESPLHEAVDRQKGVTFLEASQLLKTAAELDQSALHVYDVRTSLREALEGIKVSAKSLRDEDQINELAERDAQAQAMQKQLAALEQGGAAAEKLGRASEALA